MTINVDIDGGTAVVRPATPEVARRLIEAAAGRPVTTTTVGPTLGLVVAEAVAVAAGLVEDTAPEVVPEPQGDGTGDPEPVGDVSASHNDSDGDLSNTRPPSKNATTAEWREFFDAQGIAYDSDATRAELIDAWARR